MFRRENRAVESPKAEIAPPHIILVQNRIGSLARTLELERAYATPNDLKIVASLTDQANTTATGSLLTVRRNLVGGQEITNLDLARLAQDLEYLSIYERHGLNGLNEYLNSLIGELSPAKEFKENALVAANIDDLLRRAIYLFPHVARGVKVKVKRDFNDETDQAPGFSRLDRRDFTALREQLEEKGRDPYEEMLFPLPTFFTTGTHGSGERAAMMRSNDAVNFDVISQRKGSIPLVNLAIKRPIITLHYAEFALDEIESVRFSEEGEFVPYVDSGSYGSYRLIVRGNPVSHYLNFRGFMTRLSQELGKSVSETQWNILKKTGAPELYGELWASRSNLFGVTADGYLVEFDEKEDGNVLHRLTNFRCGNGYYDKILEEFSRWKIGKKRCQITSFNGGGIFEELVTVPPDEKAHRMNFISGKQVAKKKNKEVPGHSSALVLAPALS